MGREITRAALGSQRNSAGKRLGKEMGAAARLAIHPPFVFACILAVQKLIRSDDPDAFHFLANGGAQILKKRANFLSGTAAGSSSRDSGAELPYSVI